MKVFTRDYRITGEYHGLWRMYFGGMEPCVLDIEATGLDRMRCRCVLIGLLMCTDSGVRITQFLAENHYEEYKVLDVAMDYLEENNAGYLVTFNGHAYDLPFINARLDADLIDRHISMYNFDLYRFLVKCTDLKSRIGSMSQMNIEDHYGILADRRDTISGRENIALFDQYALNGNSTIEKVILTHNREDVLHLHRLMYLALAEVPDMHQALAAYGIPAAGGRLSVRPHIKRSGPAKDPRYTLKINGEQIRDPAACAYFPDDELPAAAVFNQGSRSLEIEIPLSHRGDECYLDISGFIKKSASSDAPALFGSPESLRDDPDCINDFLILNPRTVNLVSRALAGFYLDFPD